MTAFFKRINRIPDNNHSERATRSTPMELDNIPCETVLLSHTQTHAREKMTIRCFGKLASWLKCECYKCRRASDAVGSDLKSNGDFFSRFSFHKFDLCLKCV